MTADQRIALHLWLVEEMGFCISSKRTNSTIYAHLDYQFNVVVPYGEAVGDYDPELIYDFVIGEVEKRRDSTHALHA